MSTSSFRSSSLARCNRARTASRRARSRSTAAVARSSRAWVALSSSATVASRSRTSASCAISSLTSPLKRSISPSSPPCRSCTPSSSAIVFWSSVGSCAWAPVARPSAQNAASTSASTTPALRRLMPSKLARLTPVPGMVVMAAHRGGTFREAISLGKAYTEAQKEESSELVHEIVSARPEFNRERYKTPEELRERGLTRIREAVNLLEVKATPEEVDEYKKFIVDVADTVAHAKKEGGVLGIGGKPVSDEEQTALDEIAQTLEVEPPAKP